MPSHASDTFSHRLPELANKREDDDLALDTDHSSDHSPPITGKTQVFFPATEGGEEELIADDDPRVKDLPPYVRKVVSLQDDSTLPTLTFRYFLLSFLFVAPGAFMEQMNSFRTTSAPYSIFFVQIASNYVGVWLAKVLPAWDIHVPFTPWSFNMNPGPFSVKEHVLITITAASGATSNLGFAPLAISELYLGQPVNAAKSIFFMLAIVWTGMSYAALARQFLIYDPVYPW
jgi:OPT oligopeptide transporter protein